MSSVLKLLCKVFMEPSESRLLQDFHELDYFKGLNSTALGVCYELTVVSYDCKFQLGNCSTITLQN